MKKGIMLIGVLVFTMMISGCGSKESSKTSSFDIPSAQASFSKDSTSSEKSIQQGLTYLNQGDFKKAIGNLMLAIRQNPSDSRGYLILGQTFISLKNYDGAVSVLKSGTIAVPEDGHIYYLLSLAQRFNGDSEQALQAAQKSVVLFEKAQDAVSFKKSLVLVRGLMSAEGQTQK